MLLRISSLVYFAESSEKGIKTGTSELITLLKTLLIKSDALSVFCQLSIPAVSNINIWPTGTDVGINRFVLVPVVSTLFSLLQAVKITKIKLKLPELK